MLKVYNHQCALAQPNIRIESLNFVPLIIETTTKPSEYQIASIMNHDKCTECRLPIKLLENTIEEV